VSQSLCAPFCPEGGDSTDAVLDFLSCSLTSHRQLPSTSVMSRERVVHGRASQKVLRAKPEDLRLFALRKGSDPADPTLKSEGRAAHCFFSVTALQERIPALL